MVPKLVLPDLLEGGGGEPVQSLGRNTLSGQKVTHGGKDLCLEGQPKKSESLTRAQGLSQNLRKGKWTGMWDWEMGQMP